LLLTDDVVIQEIEYLPRLWQVFEANLGRLGQLLFDDVVAKLDALVTDVHPWTSNQLFHLLLRFTAEAALD